MKFFLHFRICHLPRFILLLRTILTIKMRSTLISAIVLTKKNGAKKPLSIRTKSFNVVDRIKLLLDEDVHSTLSSIIQKRGFDVEHVQEANGKGRSDLDQLLYACKKKRCLMSFNVRDFVLLHNRFVQEGMTHWGIIVSKQLPIGETLRRILAVLQGTSRQSMKNRILFLSKKRK